MGKVQEDITLSFGQVQFYYIELKDCYLTIQNEKDNPHYTLGLGVDVAKNDTLFINCIAKNNFAMEQTVIPSFNTYFRSSFGKLISSNEFQSINLEPNQETSLSFAIPKAIDAQAYAVILELQSKHQPISNKITAHYVIQGTSATIQNLRLDKDYYQKGEQANLSFFWDASGDDLSGITFNLSIQNSNNAACIDPITKSLAANDKKSPQTELSASIIQDCANPNLTVSIKDKGGKVLDAQTFSVKSKNVPPQNQGDKKLSKALVFVVVFIVTVLLLIIIISYYFKKKQESNNLLKSLLLFLLVGAGIFLCDLKGVRADTWVTSSNDLIKYKITVTYNLDDDTYGIGQTATATGGVIIDFEDGVIDEFRGDLYATINNNKELLFVKSLPEEEELISNTNGKRSFAVESTVGTYKAVFDFDYKISPIGVKGWLINNSVTIGNIPYKVIAPPTVSLSASPVTVCSGSSTTLTWAVTNGVKNGCVASGDWSSYKDKDGGTQTMTGITSDKNYTLTCTNAVGSASDSVTVSVKSKPTVSLSASPSTVDYGEGTTLTWAVTNGVKNGALPGNEYLQGCEKRMDMARTLLFDANRTTKGVPQPCPRPYSTMLSA